jgi:hypothetical protein
MSTKFGSFLLDRKSYGSVPGPVIKSGPVFAGTDPTLCENDIMPIFRRKMLKSGLGTCT